MQEFVQKQLVVGASVLVLLLVLAQIIDGDYRSAATTTAAFCTGFLVVEIWLRWRKSRTK